MLNTFETFLENTLNDFGVSTTQESMAYSLLGGGKRLRPLMLFTLLEAMSGNPSLGNEAAAALEMIHTYSLVHDDLPAMDNDDYRRHKLTNHKVFGEGQAILAGDALLTGAFEVISNAPLSADILLSLVSILAKAAGAQGMILGQELDTKDDINSLDELNRCYELKTGCLFAAAFEMAVVLANRFDLREVARDIGLKLGIAFQYQDDILEVSQSFEEIGKSNDSDVIRDKSTVVSFVGLEQAKMLTDTLYDEIHELLQSLPLRNQKVQELINTMISRKY